MRIKILVSSLIFLLVVAGCAPKKQLSEQKCSFGAFRDEIYVWEGYQFTTNQVKDFK